MDINLTHGAIAKAMRDEYVDRPIFQILGYKKTAGEGGQDRFRLQLSDGLNTYNLVMLATQLNNLVTDDVIDNFSIIQVDKMFCNTMNSRRIMILLSVDMITKGAAIGHKIGNPIPWNDNGSNPPPPQQAVNEPLPTTPLRNNDNSSGVAGGISFYGQSSDSTSKQGHDGNSYGNSNSSTGGGGGGHNTDLSSAPKVPIRDLSAYVNKATTRARVTKKGDIRTWSNCKGEGKLFSVDLLDDSGDIRCTIFNKHVDDFYDILEVNKVYYISKVTAKAANKQYNTCSHDWELGLTQYSQITPDTTDTSDIPKISYNFVAVKDLENLPKDSTVDVIGICKKLEEVQTFTAKSGKEYTKREMILVDTSDREVSVTLWGKQAEEFHHTDQPVVALKKVKVSDFGGRTLSGGDVQVNPDLPEAHKVRAWFDNGGGQTATSISSGRGGGGGAAPFKTCTEAHVINYDADPAKADYFMAKVHIIGIRKENCLYKACGKEGCNKKAIVQGNGLYRCEKCNDETPNFKWRLMCSINFADFTDNFWATGFGEVGEVLFQKSAEALGELHENSIDEFEHEFEQLLSKIKYDQYIGKFRSTTETYDNETRKKINVVELTKINFHEYSKKLLQEIHETSS